MSLHWVNDLPGTLIQIGRILKPDGLFLAAMLGGATLWQLRQALAAAEREVEGGLSPRVSPFADLRDAAGLLQRAGFALPVADDETIEVEYPSALSLMRSTWAPWAKPISCAGAAPGSGAAAPPCCARPKYMPSAFLPGHPGGSRPSFRVLFSAWLGAASLAAQAAQARHGGTAARRCVGRRRAEAAGEKAEQ